MIEIQREADKHQYDAINHTSEEGHDAGGHFIGTGVRIDWQRGPRRSEPHGAISEKNGAFVEDVIYAALQRLEHFQGGKFPSEHNVTAIDCLKQALLALGRRQIDRIERGVEGMLAE